MRKALRHYFIGNKIAKLFYDIVTWALTVMLLTYYGVSFAILGLYELKEYYNSVYWLGHITVLLGVIIAPILNYATKNQQK